MAPRRAVALLGLFLVVPLLSSQAAQPPPSLRIEDLVLVTGHTTLLAPGLVPPPADINSEGVYVRPDIEGELAQVECLAWFNGADAPPASGPFPNSYPSDEDSEQEIARDADGSLEYTPRADHDHDRELSSCEPQGEWDPYWLPPRIVALPTDFAAVAGHVTSPSGHTLGRYAIAVEVGDCDPVRGRDFRYRGELDFVDGNGILHEVQEYDYACTQATYLAAAMTAVTFPWSDCEVEDPEWPMGDGCRDWGETNEQNASFQEVTRERLWITSIHEPVWDPAADAPYSWALIVDTCAGQNVHTTPTDILLGLDWCSSGSTWSFDDTARGWVAHDAAAFSSDDVRAGSSMSLDGSHRAHCRAALLEGAPIEWPFEWWGYTGSGPGCFPEPHRSARVDIILVPADPTGLFALH